MDGQLTYKIYLPRNIKEGEKYPVIYAMHGMGSDEEDILSLIGELKNDFILIGIRGSIIQGRGFAYFSIKGYGNPDRESFDKAVKSLEEFIHNAAVAYPIDNNRQYLLGFSQGSILSMSLALVMGNKVKGIAALSGYIPRFVKEEYKIKSVEDVSVFISHGEFDPIFPLDIGKDNYEFFRERSRNVIFKTYPSGHEVSLKNINDVIRWLNDERQKEVKK
ncbi:alpha/beta hydrolase [Clostridium folliculivorans]|uniref:Phospholipase n=1 Tax=Clostridium folliculivorans TaxID=2886038 RepID=A0A9W5Y538_9CLOT|nr:alpha/beta hydrolase-fold protein [Clostridium folliculivorans]GKU26831.1 phospholipase [Clostridium folliculivorans]GKU31425.1 phospholipase [Clostridium folliculivorans]